MSTSQSIPYRRLSDWLSERFDIPLSEGTISNMLIEGYRRLEDFESKTKEQLRASLCNHADETGVRVGTQRIWKHVLSNPEYVLLHISKRRGSAAFDEMGVLDGFNGVLVHDFYRPYFTLDGMRHGMCVAHLIRELERSSEVGGYQWASQMQSFLSMLCKEVERCGGRLSDASARHAVEWYRAILHRGNVECPEHIPKKKHRKKGKVKQSQSRNLLARLINYEEDVLRFTHDIHVPSTNNQAERDIRNAKVKQKVSGCFRSMLGVKAYARIRGCELTMKRHGVPTAVAYQLIYAADDIWSAFQELKQPQ